MSKEPRQSVRVLVTGFGPFPDIPHNASAALARALETSVSGHELELATAIIPVVWARARAAARQAIARFQPHAVLHFGVSKLASCFQIETRAFNMSGPKADQAGAVRPNTPLVSAGAPVLMATLPPLHLFEALTRRGFPAAMSHDAGRYLCNAVFYWSLCDSSPEEPLVSFVHIPAFGAGPEVEPRLTLEEAVAGARILVRASVEAVLRARQNGPTERGGSIGHGSEALHRDRRRGSRSPERNSG